MNPRDSHASACFQDEVQIEYGGLKPKLAVYSTRSTHETKWISFRVLLQLWTCLCVVWPVLRWFSAPGTFPHPHLGMLAKRNVDYTTLSLVWIDSRTQSTISGHFPPYLLNFRMFANTSQCLQPSLSTAVLYRKAHSLRHLDELPKLIVWWNWMSILWLRRSRTATSSCDGLCGWPVRSGNPRSERSKWSYQNIPDARRMVRTRM